MDGRSGSRNVRQLATGAPLKVQLPNKSIAAKSPAALDGLRGFPFRSTVGLPPLALPLSTPGKYRKIPCCAMGVNVQPTTFSRLRSRSPSNKRKKNVLFLMIGPPRRAPYWLRLSKLFATPLKLLNQLLASTAELWFAQKALPRN